MLAVSAAELASIQAELASAVCDKSGDIYHKTTVRGPSGEPSATWTYFATTKVGMSEPSGNELQNFDFLLADKVAWKLHFPVGTSIGEQDHVVIEGQTLEIHVLLTPKSYPGLLSCIAGALK